MSFTQKVIKIIADHLSLKSTEITVDSNIINDLKSDSLDFIEIISQIEQEFDIKISDEESDNLKTIRDFCVLILYHLLKKNSAKFDDKNLNIINSISSNQLLEHVNELKKIDEQSNSSEIKSIIEELISLSGHNSA